MTGRSARQSRPTLHDVAARAGVSIASVSNYLNGYQYMRPATKERIAAAIKELGYVANATARNLKSGRTGLLSLSIPDLNQVYFAELSEEIIAAAREYDYRVIVESTGNDAERELSSVRSMGDGRTDGLILSPVKMSNKDLPMLEGSYPLVLLGERVFGAPAPHVIVKNMEAAERATELLLESGCRRIAIIGGTLEKSSSSRSLRTRGYINALHKHGLPVDLSLIRETREWTSLSAAQAITEMFSEGIYPDGFFALNDLLALGTISRLRDLGVAIPEDAKVIGFDNITEAAYNSPSLTTVDPGKHDIARIAVKLLIEQIRNGGRAPRQSVFVDFDIVYRSSLPMIGSDADGTR